MQIGLSLAVFASHENVLKGNDFYGKFMHCKTINLLVGLPFARRQKMNRFTYPLLPYQ